MALIFFQEENTFKNIVNIKNEDWGFDSISELRACEDFLNKNFINYSVSYSFEVYHIIIKDSIWEDEISSNSNDLQEIEKFDKSLIDFLSSLIYWKTKGSRPKPVDILDLDPYRLKK